MKKLSYILFLAVAFFASCQKHHDTLQGSQEDAWIYDMSLPVPIKFGEGDILTKAGMVDGKEFGEDDRVGIFAYDKAGSDLSEGNMLLNNAKAKAGTGKSLVFVRGDGTSEVEYEEFYPLSSSTCYTFSGIHPYPTDPDNMKDYRDGKCKFYSYRLGHNDIMFAVAAAEKLDNAVDGYNARYIRYITENKMPDLKPKLVFEHLLTAVTFNVVSADTNPTGNVTVTGFRILDTCPEVKVVVASVDPDYPVGTVVQWDNATGAKISAVDASASETLDIVPTSDPTTIDTFLLKPSTSFRCQIDVMPNSPDILNPEVSTSEFTVSPPVGVNMFEKGKHYRFTVKVHEAGVANLTYDILEWGGPTDVNQDIVIGGNYNYN